MGQEYLIDTNVIIDFFGGKLTPATQSFVSSISPSISVITEIELFSSNKLSVQELSLLNRFVKGSKIYNQINSDIVDTTSVLRRTYNIKLPDALIAATAIAYSLTLISRNDKDFAQIKNLKYLNTLNILK